LLRSGVLDIGNATAAALRRFERQPDARTSGDPSERSSGNGSIMRLAPVPIRYLDLFPGQIARLCSLAVESSLPTHGSPQCLSACRYLTLVLCGLLHGIDRDHVLAPNWEPLRILCELEALYPEIDAVARGSFRKRQPPEIRGSGYVVASLEAALWAFCDAEDFQQAVLRAVNLGDDADTTGAICGQLAGACWGESGIPARWLRDLARKDMIETALTGLLPGESLIPRTFPLAAHGSIPPTPCSCWVVEGQLLAGAFPGSSDPTDHRQRIKTLVDAGLRTF
jgi:ADP-ribosylglycohydrolase